MDRKLLELLVECVDESIDRCEETEYELDTPSPRKEALESARTHLQGMLARKKRGRRDDV